MKLRTDQVCNLQQIVDIDLGTYILRGFRCNPRRSKVKWPQIPNHRPFGSQAFSLTILITLYLC